MKKHLRASENWPVTMENIYWEEKCATCECVAAAHEFVSPHRCTGEGLRLCTCTAYVSSSYFPHITTTEALQGLREIERELGA